MNAIETKKTRSRIAAALGLAVVAAAILLSTPGASHAQTEVRDLDNPAKQPFQAELQRLRIPSSGGGESFQVANVPPGKRLVIEHVSFRVASLEASTPGSPPPRFGAFASLVTKVNGVPGSHELIVNQIDLSGGRIVPVASQPIRAYADPGSKVFVRIAGRTEDDSADHFWPFRRRALEVKGRAVLSIEAGIEGPIFGSRGPSNVRQSRENTVSATARCPATPAPVLLTVSSNTRRERG